MSWTSATKAKLTLPDVMKAFAMKDNGLGHISSGAFIECGVEDKRLVCYLEEALFGEQIQWRCTSVSDLAKHTSDTTTNYYNSPFGKGMIQMLNAHFALGPI
jgi:hypothetical protein